MKQHNFSAGPSILPTQVLQKASESVLDLNQTGLSILEISHRSTQFVKIITHHKSSQFHVFYFFKLAMIQI